MTEKFARFKQCSISNEVHTNANESGRTMRYLKQDFRDTVQFADIPSATRKQRKTSLWRRSSLAC